MNFIFQKKYKKYLLSFFVIFFVFCFSSPLHAFKINGNNYEGLVPPCNTETNKSTDIKDPTYGQFTNPCGINNLMELANNIINFLLFYISVPIASLIFVYAGFTYMTSGGDTGKRSKAHDMFKNVIIGFVVAMAAWLIIHVILMALGYDGAWVGL